MATTVERTLDEIGLDLTGVDFCTTNLLALLRSVLKFPDGVGELSGSPGMISGLSVHSGYDTSWMLLAPQASSRVTVLHLDKRRIVLSSPIWKKIQICLLSLQNHLWARSPGWCKSPRCHWAITGTTPVPTSPDPTPAWAVPTFPCPGSGAWSAAPQHFHVADTPLLCH